MPENEMELTQSQLMIVGSLTGAAAHELNNIMGILSLRLEKLQEDLELPAGESNVAGAGSERLKQRDMVAMKDLAVMERNLGRAVGLIGHLQSLMKAGADSRLCAEPGELRQAILDAIETQQSIYERKAVVNHSVGMINIRPVSRGRFHLFLVSALQRVTLSVGPGSMIDVAWAADEDKGGGRLTIRGQSAGVDPGASHIQSGPAAVLGLLAGQTESLAAGLLGEDGLASGFSWSVNRSTSADAGADRLEVLLTLQLAA